MFSGFLVAVANTPQPQAFSPTDDLNDVIGSDTGPPAHRAALQKLINGVAFEAGHEKDGFFLKGSKPGVADVRLVKNHYGGFGQFQGLSHTTFMCFGVGDGYESRDMPVMVQQGVHFDAAFGLAERSPWEERKAKLDGGSVQAEQLGFEAKFVLRSFCRAQAVHFGEQVMKKAHGPVVVRISER